MRFRFNPYRSVLEAAAPSGAREFHRSLANYVPTPLVTFKGEDRGTIYVKDESRRFGLNAFKALGASWAMRDLPARHFSAATDGNHGRAVAWMARRLGGKSTIFVPANMAMARISNLTSEGAEVVVVQGTYDEAVRRCAAESASKGWQVISDTGYAGYVEIPWRIMEGYRTMFEEAEDQMLAEGLRRPDLVIIQAGVGGLLCAAVRHFRSRPDQPAIVCVEPESADCLITSIESEGGQPAPSPGRQDSIMSGLNCGEVSLAAWSTNRAGVGLFLTIEDLYAAEAMRRLARNRPPIIAGESGAAGLGAWIALWEDPRFEPARERLGLSRDSAVLVVNTEGATDPESYRRIVDGQSG